MSFLRRRGRTVHWIGVGGDGDVEATRHLDRKVIYAGAGKLPCFRWALTPLFPPLSRLLDANDEKQARATIMAAVERLLTKDVTVVLDWLNYIKGWRYQVFCVAKTCSTPVALVRFKSTNALG